MKVVRTFHPVGQGAFYSERFYDGTQLNATHNIVFDCGVSFGNEWKVAHVVNQAFTNDDVIDYLFISHLDYDHVSLVKTLISQVKRVENIVLPLVSFDDLRVLYAYYRISRAQGGAEFVHRIIENIAPSTNIILDKKDDGVVVHMVGDVDDNSIDIGNARRWVNGSESYTGWEPEWVLIPYNVEYKSRQMELIGQFDSLVADKTVAGEINATAGVEIKSGEELLEKLKDEIFVEEVLKTASLRNVIKKAYENIKGGTNENSILLYSGPTRKESGYGLIDCTPCCSWYNCCTHKAGCLYTGDSTCDMADWEQKYSVIWGLIGTIQLPHHGSVDSFDVLKNKIGGRFIFPVSFGSTNTYGHPSGKVLAYLRANRCCVPMITELANSIYMQVIEKASFFLRR